MGDARPLPHDGGLAAALRALGLASLTLTMPTETVPFVAGFAAASPSAVPGLALLVASQLLCAGALLVRRHHWSTGWMALGLLVAGLWQAMSHSGGFDFPALVVPGYWLFPVVALAMRSGSRHQQLLHIAVSTASMLVVQAHFVGTQGWEDIADQVWIIQPVAEVALFSIALQQVSARHRDAVARQVAAAEENLERATLTSARREAARMLHDHVLHALDAIARAKDPASVPLVVAKCREASAAMLAGSRPAELVRVEDLIAADGALAAAGARLEGGAPPLPSAVAGAVAAAHEALTNVRRHARADGCTVRLRPLGGGVEVQVVDDGVGFDPGSRPAGHFGLGSSITERMEDIGGSAATVSAAGQGTTVRLQWPRRGRVRETSWFQSPDAMVRRVLTPSAWPGLVALVLMSMLAAPEVTHPAVGFLLGIATAVLGAVVAVVLQYRPLPRWGQVSVLVWVLAVWAANLWMVPHAPETDYPLWLAWGASTVVHLLVLAAPVHEGLAMVLVWGVAEVGGLVWRYGADATDHSLLVVAGAGDVAITLVVLLVARRVAAREAEGSELEMLLRHTTARLTADAHLQDFWSARVTGEALPLVREVAEGAISPTDVAVQRRARELEATLRDELLLGSDPGHLLDRLAAVRHQGWQLTSTLDADDSEPVRHAAARLLGLLDDPPAEGQTATLSAVRDQAVLVVTGASQRQQDVWLREAAALGARVDVVEGLVRVRMGTALSSGSTTAS